MPTDEENLIGLTVAFAVGLMIGIERERSKGTGPDREVAGVRTFALISLVGATSFLLGSMALFGIFALILGVFIAIGYRRTRKHDPGLTTEVAMLAAFLLGGLAMTQRYFAAGIAVAITIVLAARTRLHDWVRNVLTDQEVRDGLMLAAAALIVLPLAPAEAVDPWGVISLRQLWMLAILIMAINALGYIALRVVGPKIGLSLAGLFSGFVSSTATIGAMGAHTRRQPQLHASAVAGAAASSLATVVQLAIVVGLVELSVLRALAAPLVASGAAALAYAGFFAWRSARAPSEHAEPAGRPFEPKTAILFVAVVGLTLLISAALTHWLGDRGLVLAAGLAGFSDAHAGAISAATFAQAEQVSSSYAVFAILVAFTTNTVSKCVVAFSLGTRQFAAELLPGLILMAAAAWLGWLVTTWLS